MSEIADNLHLIKGRIAAAAGRAGRDPRDILLLAVSKTFPAQTARAAFDAGQTHFGENRVQEARDKAPLLPPQAVWHLIGPLQGNKVKYCPGLFAWVHSLDSAPLARELGKRYRAAGKSVKTLVQVNVGGEEQKSGCRPQEAGEVLAAALAEEGVTPCGLMCLPPWAEDPEETRPHFRALRELRDGLLDQGFPPEALFHLSMGMSHDYEVAIEEGATIVRVGSALFGKRG